MVMRFIVDSCPHPLTPSPLWRGGTTGWCRALWCAAHATKPLMQPTAVWMQRAAENAAPRSVSFRRMPTVTLTRNQRALAWALGIMALLAAVAVTRHHIEMMDHSPGGHYLTWGHAISQQAPDYILWALTIPLVYLFVDRVARRRWGWRRTWLAHPPFAPALGPAATPLPNGRDGRKSLAP